MPLRSKINCLYIIGKGEDAIEKKGKAAFIDYLNSKDGEPVMDRIFKGLPKEDIASSSEGSKALTPTPIYRHGESEANEDNVKSTPETPLTDKGVEEAKILGDKLKKEGITTIYHSDYVRSRQTADEAAAIAGAKTKLLPNSEEKRSDETDAEFIKRVAGLKKEIAGLPPHSTVISHGLVMKAMQALDETNGNEAEAAKIYRKLPFVKNTEPLKTGGQDAIQKQEPDESVLGNEGVSRQSELPRVGEGNEEHQTAAPSRASEEETPKEIEILPEKPTFSTTEKQTHGRETGSQSVGWQIGEKGNYDRMPVIFNNIEKPTINDLGQINDLLKKNGVERLGNDFYVTDKTDLRGLRNEIGNFSLNIKDVNGNSALLPYDAIKDLLSDDSFNSRIREMRITTSNNYFFQSGFMDGLILDNNKISDNELNIKDIPENIRNNVSDVSKILPQKRTEFISALSDPKVKKILANGDIKIKILAPHEFGISTQGFIKAHGNDNTIYLNPDAEDFKSTILHEAGELWWKNATKAQRDELLNITKEDINNEDYPLDIRERAVEGLYNRNYINELNKQGGQDAVQEQEPKIEDIPEGKNLTGQVVKMGKQTFHVINDNGGSTIKAIPLEDDNDTYAGAARVIKRGDLEGYMPGLDTKFHVRMSYSLDDKMDNKNAIGVATLVHKTLPNLKDVFILNKEDFKQALKDVGGFTDANFMANKDVQPLSTKLGDIQGFVNGNQMFIDADNFNSNVVMHEGSHLFLKWAKNNASHIYNEGLKLMDGTPYMTEVLHNPFYINRANKLMEGGMTHYEALNELRDEALALAVGDKGERMAEHIKPPFIRWLNGLWGSVKNYFGYGKPAIEKMSPDQISNMTYGQFADAISSRLLSGRRLEGKAASGSPSFSVRNAPDFDRIWDAALDRAKSENIDTKDIDGVMRYIRDYFKTTTGNSYDHDMLFDRLRDMNRKTKAGIPVSHIREIAQDENDPVSNEPYSGDADDKMTLEEKASLAAQTLRKTRKAPKEFKETAFAKTARQVYNVFDNIHGEEGKVTKTLMDKALGKMNALQLRHYQLLEKMKRDFYGMSEKDRILFISRMRSGEKQSTQKLDDYAYTLNGIFDEAFKGLSKISDINMLDNYFPQFWKRPDDYTRFVESHRKTNAPIEGSADFLKERMINDLADGINAGLVPVSTNPAILAQLYLRNSAKYQMAHALLSDLLRKGLAIPSVDGVYNSITGERMPASFEEGGYSIFKNFARQYYKMEAKAGRGEKTITTKSGKVTIKPYGGKIYVPPETNEALGSIFGNGLMNTNFDNIFRAVGNMGNHLNFMQLSLSGYHMLTTTGNFIGTHMGLAVSDLLSGKIGSAAVDLGKAIAFPLSIAKAFKHYQDLIKSNDAGMYNDPSLKMLIEAGGRLRPDPIYRDNWRNTLLKNYSELKNGDETNKMWGTAKVLGDSFMATMTSATDFIMEHWVPVLKMQAFTDLAQSELMRIKPSTDMERMQLLQDAYTHIENRFGQMDYNRLFMNRAIKEGSFLMFRASGWTIGVMREGAGALMGGMVKSIKRLGKGQGLNPDTAFLLGLVATNAAACGIYNQIRWGGLTGWRDLIGYRTGNINKDGTPEYRMPLAFVREWYAYGKDIPSFIEHGDIRQAIGAAVGNFSTEMSNKISPAISFMQEIIKNKDYFGDPIFSHHDFLSDNDKESYISRVMDSKIGDGIKFLSSNIIPISFRGENNSDNPLDPEYWTGFFSGSGMLQRSGVTRAPMDFDRQTWQNVIMDKYYKTTGSTDFTFNRKYITLYNNILKGIANIHTGDETKNGLILNSLISAGQEDGVLKPYQNLDYFIKKYQNYYPNHFAALNPSDMLDIIGSGLIPASEVPSLLTGYSSEKRGTVKSILDKYAKEHADIIAATSKYKRAMQIVDSAGD